ncbi:sensor histidine kinase [Nakamurella panacisegetis]|nr:PAS domain S-box protein [Nakamurella panacisegetis]
MTAPPDDPAPPAELQPLYKAILDAAMDAVITIDHHGRVLEWNMSAELIFGYGADEVLGRELAELIVPADTRQRHRAGLHRLAGGGMAAMLDRRVEVIAQRADGQTFPVELTITRVVSTAGVMYSGFLRDISDRRQLLADLRSSRRRLLSVSDEARRRVERDLHDGAQQQLVAVAIALGAARSTVESDPAATAQVLDTARDVLNSAISELRELAQGIHSPTLTERGLPAALQELARRSAIPVDVTVDLTDRLPVQAETTVYYFVAEALTNAAKHGATAGRVQVDLNAGTLRCVVSDDGPGGADPSRGSGLRGLGDRMSAVDGRLHVHSPDGEGTTLTATMPLVF